MKTRTKLFKMKMRTKLYCNLTSTYGVLNILPQIRFDWEKGYYAAVAIGWLFFEIEFIFADAEEIIG